MATRRTPRIRHLRHRDYDKIRRSKRLKLFFTDNAEDLDTTGADIVFTFNPASATEASDVLTLATVPAAGDWIQIDGRRYTFRTTPATMVADDIVVGLPAIQTLTLTGNAVADETVVVGAVTYTWKASVGATANQILIGASASDSLDNLIAAINLAAGSGTLYGSSTVVHPTAFALAGAGDTMIAVARTVGTGGNSLASTETMTNGSWGAATFAGGAAATVVNTQASIELALEAGTGAGYRYGTGTVVNADVDSDDAAADGTAIISALVGGTSGNFINAISSFADEDNGFASEFLTGGADLDTLAATAHGLAVGDGPFVITAATTLPTGVVAGDLFWVQAVPDANSFKLCNSRGSRITFKSPDDGTGTLTLTKAESAEAIFEYLRTNSPAVVAAATDVDDL